MDSNISITEHSAVIDHKQIYPLSCIPSAIEMILKWLNRVPESYYELQDEWNNKKVTFRNFIKEPIKEVEFKGKFLNYDKPCATFPFDELFETIDKELAQCKCVLVMLPNPKNQKHIWIIYDNKTCDYQAFTKYIVNNNKIIYWEGVPGVYKGNIRDYIIKLKWTHLLIYDA